jgi:4-hydroxybenzoyl-CoA thioesterase
MDSRDHDLAYFSQYEINSVKRNLLEEESMSAAPEITIHHATRIPIEWGDCDAAGIVFYPNYFRWFDVGLQRLLKSRGHTQASLGKAYGIIGTPLLEAAANFHAAARYDEELDLAMTITDWKRSTFRVIYRGSVGDRHVISGHEVRAFVTRNADGKLSSVTIPDGFRALFQA